MPLASIPYASNGFFGGMHPEHGACTGSACRIIILPGKTVDLGPEALTHGIRSSMQLLSFMP